MNVQTLRVRGKTCHAPPACEFCGNPVKCFRPRRDTCSPSAAGQRPELLACRCGESKLNGAPSKSRFEKQLRARDLDKELRKASTSASTSPCSVDKSSLSGWPRARSRNRHSAFHSSRTATSTHLQSHECMPRATRTAANVDRHTDSYSHGKKWKVCERLKPESWASYIVGECGNQGLYRLKG
eukprot:6207645-Pleurochrysis_carterae.AAC.4